MAYTFDSIFRSLCQATIAQSAIVARDCHNIYYQVAKVIWQMPHQIYG